MSQINVDIISGNASDLVQINGRVAEGFSTTASGENSHAEGLNTTAIGESSHS